MYNGKIVEWPLGCNSHGDHLMGWKSRQDLSNRNIYSRGKHEPFLLKINTYIVYMAYFYSTKYHTFLCFVHGEIRCAIAGDQVMGMRQYIWLFRVALICHCITNKFFFCNFHQQTQKGQKKFQLLSNRRFS